eukprot:GSA120T00010891001.1
MKHVFFRLREKTTDLQSPACCHQHLYFESSVMRTRMLRKLLFLSCWPTLWWDPSAPGTSPTVGLRVVTAENTKPGGPKDSRSGTTDRVDTRPPPGLEKEEDVEENVLLSSHHSGPEESHAKQQPLATRSTQQTQQNAAGRSKKKPSRRAETR